MQRVSTLITVAATSAVVGCAPLTNPYISLPQPADLARVGIAGPEIDEALNVERAVRADMETRRDAAQNLKFGTNFLEFASVMAGVGFAAFKGSADSLKIAGLTGGGAYVAQTVWAPDGLIDAYRSGVTALVCVESAAAPQAGALRSLSLPMQALHDAMSVLKSELARTIPEVPPAFATLPANASQTDQDKYAAEVSAYNRQVRERDDLVMLHAQGEAARADGTAAYDRALRLRSVAPALGTQITNAVIGIADAVNKRVRNEQVTAAQIGDLVRGVAALNGVTPQAQKPGQPSAAGPARGIVAPRGVSPPGTGSIQVEQLRTAISNVQSAALGIPQTLQDVSAAATVALSACALGDVAVQPLTVSPASTDAIVLANGETRAFTVKGGKAPYHAYVVGYPMINNKLTVDPFSQTGQFVMTAQAGLSPDDTLVVSVYDTSSPQLTLEQAAQVKGKAPPLKN